MKKWNEQEISVREDILGCAQNGSLENRAIALLHI